MIKNTWLCLMLVAGAAMAATETVTDDDIQPGDTVRWTADNTYLLDGFVFVDSGAVLHIAPGTVVKGKPGQGSNASALVVARHGKLYAIGTKNKPIIFTSQSDDPTRADDLPMNTRGMWGGVILLGNATINTSAGVGQIEGIPSTEARGAYGGSDDEDNSGILRFVSIRHGGTEIGEGNEINGLTMGAVGSGTTIEFVEVINNKDDGFEWFGGTVHCRYLVAAFCGDDAFDYDEGFRGRGQYWFAIMRDDGNGEGDKGGEHDGGTDPEDGEPYSMPVIANVTYIGPGSDVGGGVLNIRDNAGGKYYNSIFMDFEGGASVEDLESGADSRQRLSDGELVLANNIWYSIGDDALLADIASGQTYLRNHLQDNDNDVSDPALTEISRSTNAKLDPRPTAESPAFENVGSPDDDTDFIQSVDYRGAFSRYDLWIRDWTALDEYGFVVPKGAVVEVTDEDILPGQEVDWTNDNTYLLNGFVFVDDGAVLNIEAGTVIKGAPGQGANSSALIVARGGKIHARGTRSEPIIFTAESDDVDDPDDLPQKMRGLWGGVILLGKARINTSAGVGQIEGIPSTEPRGAYGGEDDEDNSGLLRFVSIRHGGTEIGEGNEINGLTMGAVGSGTTIEFVEVLNNKDDGFEWFGGTARCRYLVSAFNGDDAFDYDEGFRGRGQYWFAIMRDDGNGEGDKGGEHDGGTDPEDGTPLAIPVISNVTYIGPGSDVGGGVFNIRDNAGGKYYNSIFMDFEGGASVEDLNSGADSRQRLNQGDLVLASNLWHNIGDNKWGTISEGQDYLKTHLQDNDNGRSDPELTAITRSADATLDPRPAEGSPALSDAVSAGDTTDFIQSVDYRGAFSLFDLWIRGWTALDDYGYVAEPSGDVVVVTDDDIGPGQTVNWTSDNTYLLDGFVFVEEGSILNIGPGTVIKGSPGQGANSSALIVARGGKIYARGKASDPVVFTAEADDGNLPRNARGLWGGLILLGKARINTSAGVGQIEGIPSTESRGAYGGDDDADNSGELHYVSIRYGGTEIGEGNEINGLTMGAVGNKTIIDHVEVYNNKDDGFEWFGGTVACSHLVSAFNGDDAFDYDEGFRGKGQFWFAVMRDDGNGEGDKGGEHDGGTDPEDGEPYSMPVVYNATYVGPGKDVGGGVFNIRDNAGGKYYNSIFYDFEGGASVEDLESGEDSRKRLGTELVLANNIWYSIGGDKLKADIASDQNYLKNHLEDNDNTVEDPEFISIGRDVDGKLDPRPDAEGAARSDLAEYPAGDDFYADVDYKGAFAPEGTDTWAANWTALGEKGFLDPDPIEVGIIYSRAGGMKGTQFSAGLNGRRLTVSYRVPTPERVELRVVNVDGKTVATLARGNASAGMHSLSWDLGNVAEGYYVLCLERGTKRMSVPFVVMR